MNYRFKAAYLRTSAITVTQTKYSLKAIPNSAETQDRTTDLQIFSLTLSQLSYFGLLSHIKRQTYSSLAYNITKTFKIA